MFAEPNMFTFIFLLYAGILVCGLKTQNRHRFWACLDLSLDKDLTLSGTFCGNTGATGLRSNKPHKGS